ncbi:response regulator containing a CheY-like receiver domain and an HTH DNA-binding domain [Rivularia sp. PCC 7116]|uniref:helix-turn-helix transcriptional regulator n=1 Tax=Rivularia sp. PCC 7116 TaxID=373994 RepID=UPI00029F399A|nr:LuxR C-terminal-related transcriptional regulator [Rivularia sp. PCC 7116]AFY55935.1 response regulator containing a CheY-like receiver domain and an HTH DNA-binding domain [Rivularia sp. PCC 7116]
MNISQLSKTETELQFQDQIYFLQEIVDNLEDGILILTETGELVHRNASAENICSQIDKSNLNINSVPSVIWNACNTLIQNQLCHQNLTTFSEEIIINQSLVFRLRVRRFNLELAEQSLLLVTIENRYESLKNVALSEAYQYHLTQREAEIWSLYRVTSSYKQIAQSLFITVNTVKKHIKNIRAKQQRFYPA